MQLFTLNEAGMAGEDQSVYPLLTSLSVRIKTVMISKHAVMILTDNTNESYDPILFPEKTLLKKYARE